MTQLIAVVAVWAYASVMTFVLLKLLDLVIGIRLPKQEEVLDLDTTQHGEEAYQRSSAY